MQGAPKKSGEQKKKVAKKNGSLLELGRGRQMEQRGRKISASRGAPMVNVTPLLSSLELLSPLEPLYDQWIIIVSNGSSLDPLAPMVPLSPLVTIGDIPFQWRFQPAHRHRMAPMEPFKWRHWSPMVIAIGSNGDRHWCQWRWGAPLAPLRPSPLEPLDRHWHHLLSPLSPMAPMARTPNRYDPFAFFFL